jgi:DUF4097 and DUF4098 domain-containing protein YvlB
MHRRILALSTLVPLTFLGACNASVNDDIHIKAEAGGDEGGGLLEGMSLNGDVRVDADAAAAGRDFSTVNGDIRIGERAQVKRLTTVNGRIVMESGAQAKAVQTVNGAFELGKDAQVTGAVRLVNGQVSLAHGAHVGGNVETVNGEILAHGATIDGDVSNYAGGMLITDSSVVKGGLTVNEPEDSDRGDDKPPRIVIGPGSKVLGALRFERPVELYVHETAEVGPITGAEAHRYSGDDEPGRS